MPLRAGNAATRVRIETSTKTRDPESNEEIDGWGLLREAWLSFDVRSGGEYVQGGSRYSQTTMFLTGDWMELKDVTPGMRLVVESPSRVLDIKTVLPDNDRRGRVRLECVAGEGAR